MTTGVAPDVLDVLQRSTWDGPNLKLPAQLDRALYVKVNDSIERLGGKWSRKAAAHVFAAGAREQLAALVDSGEQPEKNPLAFFRTPQALAHRMVDFAGVSAPAVILEPSAGDGAIASVLRHRFPDARVDCVELDHGRAQTLKRFDVVVEGDFLTLPMEPVYDLIAMNPPFATARDKVEWMDHVTRAFTMLAPGGVLVAIVPVGYGYRVDRRHKAFREWARSHDVRDVAVPDDAFRESGTGVSVRLLRLTAPAAAPAPVPPSLPTPPRTMTTAVLPAAGRELRDIALAEIHESPLNTRTHFDKVRLGELADSMKITGQLEPVLVRPSTLKGKPGFELAAGHRRRRAAAIAQLPSLLAIVLPLDDRAFLEILSIDNLQREDVHPLEEAQGYKNLLTLDGYNHKLIAERVGKTESYVYDRLKLLQLVPEAKKLFLANRLTLGHAIILARIPAEKQKQLIDDTAGGGGLWQRDHGHATLGFLAPIEEEEQDAEFGGVIPVSVRQLQAWVNDHVRFDPADKSNPELFPETANNLKLATMRKDKVVEITYDHYVQPEAKDKDGRRTITNRSWKRADGEPDDNNTFGDGGKPSKTCEYSVMGLVAAGEHRGESFRVCIDKKRCTVHWNDEIKARNKRERERDAGGSKTTAKATAPSGDSWELKEKQRRERIAEAEARWRKGGESVLRAIAPHVNKLSLTGKTPAIEYFLEVIQDGLYGVADVGKACAKVGVPRGETPADLIRHLIMVSLLDRSQPDTYGEPSNEADLQEALDALKIKIDVVKLLDATTPPTANAPAKAPAKKKKE